MSNYVSQDKLEDLLIGIWGGTECHHWRMVANMCYAYVLLFKGSDDNKFMQCLTLYHVADIHAQPAPTEILQTVFSDVLAQSEDMAA